MNENEFMTADLIDEELLAEQDELETSLSEQETEQTDVDVVTGNQHPVEDIEQKVYERLLNTVMQEQRQEQNLLNIRKIDSSVESLDELGDDFSKLMQTGMVDAVTAYYATVGRGTVYAPQGGKEHLVKSGGAVGVPTGKDIPRDQLAEWHEMFPEANTKTLREIYNHALEAGR